MNETKLKTLVTAGVLIDRKIRELEGELNGIKATLIQEAETRADEMVETEGGGASVRFDGEDGCTANVAFPAPALKSKVDGVGKTIEKVMQASGRHFADLFEQIPAWAPKPEFRSLAEKFLGNTSGKLIKLMTNPSVPRVSFETKKVEEK